MNLDELVNETAPKHTARRQACQEKREVGPESEVTVDKLDDKGKVIEKNKSIDLARLNPVAPLRRDLIGRKVGDVVPINSHSPWRARIKKIG